MAARSALGYEPSPSTPEEFRAYVRSEIAKWTKVIKQAGAKGN
jgi:tripartite-type tricarboxylate transporter receptor subunit TctC